MPAKKRQSFLPRRRRHDDEGEEDASVDGEVQDYASTAGSAASDGEDGASNATEEQQTSTPSPTQVKQEAVFRTTADTSAMLRGLKIEDDEQIEDLHFDTAGISPHQVRPNIQRSQSSPVQQPGRREHGHAADVQRREHSYRTERSHTETQGAGQGRGQAFAPTQKSAHTPTVTKPREQNNQWKHDLHEIINQPASAITESQVTTGVPGFSRPTPNRSFSTTTVLGTVSINVILPGYQKQNSARMVKKHYTLLPQHRPPLRRDKPVRISIPDEHPRYIFPSTERSFIFIPRAMRPNQQHRTRGRGSFGGSRRTSMYSHTPSVGMSRRPSVVNSIAGSGVHTPLSRPVIRMPMPANLPPLHNTEVYLGDNSAIIHSPSTTLPMYQPVPQKAVSVADIESPTNSTQLEGQQPFHQQAPDQPRMPHIPESAIYAQPFQPYPIQNFYYPGAMMPLDQTQFANATSQDTSIATGAQRPPLVHQTNGMVYYYDPSQQFYPGMMMPQPYYYPPMTNQPLYQ